MWELAAQKSIVDSLHLLSEVQITYDKLENSIGSNVQTILIKEGENPSSQTVAELLSKHTGIMVNSYGASGLASASIRGGSSAHTAVVWNGFNILNPLNGMINFSNIPSGFFDELKIHYGGSCSLFGSGAVSGSIHLSNKTELSKGLKTSVETSIGSFSSLSSNYRASFSSKHSFTSAKYFYSESENDFPFENRSKYGKPIEKQTNANYQRKGLLVDQVWYVNKNQSLSGHLWWQSSKTGVQTMMTNASNSVAQQDDKSIKTALNWDYIHHKYELKARSGLFYDLMNYRNPEGVEKHARHNSFQNISEAEFVLKSFPNSLLNVGLNGTFEKAVSSSFPNSGRFRSVMFASNKFGFFRKKFNIMPTIRTEHDGVKLRHPAYSFGLEAIPAKVINLHAKLSYNYRLPTFNDLYWLGSYAMGNPNLMPESGWNKEAGFSITIERFQFKTSVYQYKIENQIIWLPDENNKWMPLNKKLIQSQGSENYVSLHSSIGKTKTSFQVSYNYTSSKILKSQIDDALIGKQCVYIPKHNASFLASIDYKMFYSSINSNFCSERFYDPYHSLEPYFIINWSSGFFIERSKFKLDFSFNIFNLGNSAYQVMAFYAMPGRNYNVQIRISFNQ